MQLDHDTYQRYATNPQAYRADLRVDVNGVVRRLGDVMDGWQEADFASMDAGLMQCNGATAYKPDVQNRGYLERPRGHSKTTDLAVMVSWALAFARQPIKGFAFAADKDQAGLLKDAIATLCRVNPWLDAMLTVQRFDVLNTADRHPGQGSKLEITASDVGTSYGILPDFIIADELTHWTEGAEGLWHSISSSAAKRERCFLCVISNAGFADSWQWQVREAARIEPSWVFSRLDGVQATWMSEAVLQEQARMLPPIAYARLWENQWSSGGGDALLQSDIDAAFLGHLKPFPGRANGWLFGGGLDLGVKRDYTSVVLLGVPDARWGKIRLASHRVWKPQEQAEGKVDLSEVEQHILDLDKQFGIEQVGFDPWQAELLASRVEADAGRRRRNQRRRRWAEPFMNELPPTAANLREQASLTIESFTDRRLEMYECGALRHDLQRLRAEDTAQGFKLRSPRDGHGHGDTFSAFALALVLAHKHNLKRPVVAGTSTKGMDQHMQAQLRRIRRINDAELAILGPEDHREELKQVWPNTRKRKR